MVVAVDSGYWQLLNDVIGDKAVDRCVVVGEIIAILLVTMAVPRLVGGTVESGLGTTDGPTAAGLPRTLWCRWVTLPQIHHTSGDATDRQHGEGAPQT